MILTGIGELTRGELAGERMYVAYEQRSQEDEHSCFSDNTTADLLANARGIDMVLTGAYPGGVEGPGLMIALRGCRRRRGGGAARCGRHEPRRSRSDSRAVRPAPRRRRARRRSRPGQRADRHRGARGAGRRPRRCGRPGRHHAGDLRTLRRIDRRARFAAAAGIARARRTRRARRRATTPARPRSRWRHDPAQSDAVPRSASPPRTCRVTSDAPSRSATACSTRTGSPPRRPPMPATGSVRCSTPRPARRATSSTAAASRRHLTATRADRAAAAPVRARRDADRGAGRTPRLRRSAAGSLDPRCCRPRERSRSRSRRSRARYADGTPYTLVQPTFSVADPQFGPLGDETMISPRLAPQVIGMGLLEAIPEDDLVAAADPDDADGDGISGRPNLVWDEDAGELVLGRFGWKANVATVEQQIAGAFHGDLGITSSLHPEQDCTRQPDDCAAAIERRRPGARRTTSWPTSRSTAARCPCRRCATPSPTDVREGAALFESFGCASCHTPTQTTGDSPTSRRWPIRRSIPYTDLLLHDMGPGLADGRPDFAATGQEWRTPPLWGIGLVDDLAGCALPAPRRHGPRRSRRRSSGTAARPRRPPPRSARRRSRIAAGCSRSWRRCEATPIDRRPWPRALLSSPPVAATTRRPGRRRRRARRRRRRARIRGVRRGGRGPHRAGRRRCASSDERRPSTRRWSRSRRPAAVALDAGDVDRSGDGTPLPGGRRLADPRRRHRGVHRAIGTGRDHRRGRRQQRRRRHPRADGDALGARSRRRRLLLGDERWCDYLRRQCRGDRHEADLIVADWTESFDGGDAFAEVLADDAEADGWLEMMVNDSIFLVHKLTEEPA